MRNNLFKSLRIHLVALLLGVCATSSVFAADVKLYEFWEHQLITTLTQIDATTYIGKFTPPSWYKYIFEVDGIKYGFPNEHGVGGYNDLPLHFTTIAGDSDRFYIGDNSSNKEFGIIVVVNSGSCDITLCKPEDLPKSDPTPLSVSVNGSKLTLSDDINGFNSSISIPDYFEVTDNSVLTVGPINAGGINYGVQQQPSFTTSKLEQTQKVAVVANGQDLSITTPGIYTVSVDITNGKPSGYTIVKAQGDTRPLSVSINGNKTLLSADIDGQSGEFTVSGTFEIAAGEKLTVGPASVADNTYGVTSQPYFDTSYDQQTQTLELTAGNNAATVNVKGTYTIKITVNDGIPTLCTITRERYIPAFTLNGSAIQAEGDTYTKTLFLSKGSAPEIVFDDTHLYISQDINANDADAHTIDLSYNNAGHTVTADGTYQLVFNLDRLQMQYTCTSWRDPNDTTPDKGLSSTLPQGVLDFCQDWKTFTPDNNDIFWSQREGWSDGFSAFAGSATAAGGILVGNGSFGAIIGGTAGYLSLKLNEKGLFAGKDVIASNKAFADFGEIIINTGNYGGDPLLQLDMSNGVYSCVGRSVDWQGLSTIAAQEWLASYPDQVIAGYISTQEDNKLNISIKLESKQGAGATSEKVADNIGDIYFSGKLTGELVSYACRVRVVAYDGQVSASGGSITISDASSAMIVIAGMTDYDSSSKTFLSATDQLPAIVKNRATAAAQLGWRRLYENHVADHSALYNAMRLDLADRDNSQCSDELLNDYSAGNVTPDRGRQHENTVFNFGRYLMIASSRPAADGKGMDLPTNLQGMWAHDPKMWNCDIHTNINAEMNYWPAEVTNLSDNHLAFCNWIINLSGSNFWKWLAQEYLTKSRSASGLDGTEWTSLMALNPFGGGDGYDTNGSYNDRYNAAQAWMCSHLIQHYLFTEDKAYLARALPVLWRACRFWVRNMDRKDEGGSYVYEIPYESSPEHAPGTTGPATAHTQQLVYYLFKHTLRLLEIMPIAEATAEKVADLREKFEHLDNGMSYRASGGKNYLREWKYSDSFGQENHRHLSHLVCMYPLDLAADAPADVYESIINAMDQRGYKCGATDPAVWTTAWKVCLWARAKSSHAYEIYKSTIGRYDSGAAGTGLYSNLTSFNQCMQMEGNWGLTAGVAEMLLQSHAGYIDILPALPASWEAGSVKGIRAIGNHSVAIDWSDSKAQRIEVVSHNGNPVSLHYPGISSLNVYVDGRKVNVQRKAPGASASGDDAIYVDGLNAGSKVVVSVKRLSTGIDDLDTDADLEDASGEVRYHNLQGIPVAHPEAGGLYIRCQGNTATKVRM